MFIFAEIHHFLKKKAVLAGASGLIGSNLLQVLLQQDYYDEVLILVRHSLPLKHIKLTQIETDFSRLEEYAQYISGHALFCCLGSTKKKTPDPAVYRKIDHDYPLLLAEIARKNDVQQCHLVSSLGADPASSVSYTKMKGETEADITKVGLPCLHIYRPSFLTGDRKERRPLERVFTGLMKILDPILIGTLKKYRSIPAATVASAMFKQSINNQRGIFIHLSDEIQQLS
jgi:uncharacterized protein YbjT (DUF2867 family)